MKSGNSVEDAIPLANDGSVEINIRNIITQKLGGRDGSYFVISDSIVENMKKTKKYRVIYVEADSGKKQSIIFELL